MRGEPRRPGLLGRVLLACVLTGLAVPAAAAEEVRYALGPDDRIAISVLGQPDVSGEYVVRPDGRISLHLLGPVEIAGKSIGEVERHLGRLLAERFKSAASVVASVVQYRPVYVLGEVEAPGSYPFSFGLSAIKAIALAGGYRRAAPDAGGDFRLADEARRLQQLQARTAALEATIAALDAEVAWLDGDPDAAPPAPPEGTVGHLQLELIRARRAVLELEIARAGRQEDLALEEAESFEARRALIASQLEATEDALEMLQGLPAQSVARREQLIERQIVADRFRADELEVTAYAARARQSAETASSSAAVARTEYREDLLQARIEADQDLAAARIERDASLALIQEHADFESSAAILGPQAEVLEVFREVDGAQQRMPAQLDTPLLPGDVLRISLQSQPE